MKSRHRAPCIGCGTRPSRTYVEQLGSTSPDVAFAYAQGWVRIVNASAAFVACPRTECRVALRDALAAKAVEEASR